MHQFPEEHKHPSPLKYAKIAVFLAIITSIEVAIYYVEPLRPLLVPILIVLSVMKFVTVVAYFMHLKFDNRLFTWIFLSGLLTAVSIVVALLVLFDRFGV